MSMCNVQRAMSMCNVNVQCQCAICNLQCQCNNVQCECLGKPWAGESLPSADRAEVHPATGFRFFLFFGDSLLIFVRDSLSFVSDYLFILCCNSENSVKDGRFSLCLIASPILQFWKQARSCANSIATLPSEPPTPTDSAVTVESRATRGAKHLQETSLTSPATGDQR